MLGEGGWGTEARLGPQGTPHQGPPPAGPSTLCAQHAYRRVSSTWKQERVVRLPGSPVDKQVSVPLRRPKQRCPRPSPEVVRERLGGRAGEQSCAAQRPGLRERPYHPASLT